MKYRMSGVVYSFIQIGYFMEYAITATFSAVYLSGIGYSSVQIGFVTTIAAIFSTILQPLMASIADHTDRVTLREILAVTFAQGIICSLALIFVKGSAAPAFVFVFVIISLLVSANPLLVSLCIRLNEAGHHINYGIARALGAIGYAAGGYCMGQLTERFGITVIFPVYCAVLILILIALFMLPPVSGAEPERKQLNGESEAQTETPCSLPRFFLKYRRFDLMLLGVVLTSFMLNVHSTYLIYFVRSFGGNEADMGRLILVHAMSEVPTVAAGIWIMRKRSAQWMLRCYALFSFLQYVLMLVLPGIASYIALQLLHLLSTGMYQVPIVYFTNAVVDRPDQIKAQAVVSAAASGVTMILSNIIGGFLIAMLPIRGVIIVGSAVTLAGTILFFIATSNRSFGDEKLYRSIYVK